MFRCKGMFHLTIIRIKDIPDLVCTPQAMKKQHNPKLAPSKINTFPHFDVNFLLLRDAVFRFHQTAIIFLHLVNVEKTFFSSFSCLNICKRTILHQTVDRALIDASLGEGSLCT